MSQVVSALTRSLFPEYTVSCRPLPRVSLTSRRIIAGYLVRQDTALRLSLPYCELHPHSGSVAELLIFEDESCKHLICSIDITNRSTIVVLEGLGSTCFGINGSFFAARNVEENKLWLRVISNLRVMMQHGAAVDDQDQIKLVRDAIQEQIELIKEKQDDDSHKETLANYPFSALLPYIPSRRKAESALEDLLEEFEETSLTGRGMREKRSTPWEEDVGWIVAL
eukprot:gnl/MRDRNA2_/MRDRNA2_208108_c0_seq1.p1 gnl/MRDRNA2_/MRDRNA2_208108_c0~~gnl/MRDRNA2_/MRDRNA2_208108_c0_seq1.p1  ORF type:complete len:237 (+),score=40.79 gnl/MRDRNA2_/MRDRNA2_208108_c0_seq1:41-712(+)